MESLAHVEQATITGVVGLALHRPVTVLHRTLGATALRRAGAAPVADTRFYIVTNT
jgi:hypothetical protein